MHRASVEESPAYSGAAESRPGEARLDCLTRELESRGLSSRAAAALSAEFLIRHPFARRLGMTRLVRDMEQRGSTPEAAPGTAGVLMGIELQDYGASFAQVIEELRTHGLDGNEALASALSSARVYREICTQCASPEDAADAAFRALAWFGLAVLLLAGWARLLG